MRIRELMTTNVYTVVPETSVQEAAALLETYSISAVPVLGAGKKLLGMVRTEDVQRGKPADSVASIMMRRVVSVAPDTDIRQAVRLMTQERVRSMAVVEGGRLVGIIALSDLTPRPEAVTTLRAHRMVGMR